MYGIGNALPNLPERSLFVVSFLLYKINLETNTFCKVTPYLF